MRELLHQPWVLVCAICFTAMCIIVIFAPNGKEDPERGYVPVNEDDEPDAAELQQAFDDDYDGPDFI